MSDNNTQYVDVVGTFRCRVESPQSGWFAKAGEKETPYIRIPCTVIGGDQDGRRIIYTAWLSDGAFDATIQRLVEVFGWDGDLIKLDNGTTSFAGLECEIVTESETYEGKTRIRAKWLNAIGGGGKGMEREEVDSLLKRLQAKSKAIAKAASKGAAKPAAKPEPVTPSGAAADDGDDIPF